MCASALLVSCGCVREGEVLFCLGKHVFASDCAKMACGFITEGEVLLRIEPAFVCARDGDEVLFCFGDFALAGD